MLASINLVFDVFAMMAALVCNVEYFIRAPLGGFDFLIRFC
jgi:hypothetical protein